MTREIRAGTFEESLDLCQKLELNPTIDFRSIVLVVDGEIVLMVGYDLWTEGSVTMHQWAKHPRYFGRDILKASFKFAFTQAGRSVAIGVVRSDNPAALAVDKKIGFKEVAVIPNGYGNGVDMHILTLEAGSCRWI